MTTIDTSQLDRLADDLARLGFQAVDRVDPVVKRGVENIKGEMVADAESSDHFKGIGRTLTYDRAYKIGYVGYELGPDRGRGGQAPLAGIAYMGGANGGGGSLDLEGPTEREAPRLMRALADLLTDL